jgi:ComF family protein
MALGAPCLSCKDKTALDYLFVAAHDSTGVVRRMIHFFKYRFITDLEFPLSGLMLKSFLHCVLTNEDIVLVPVPLHQSRLKWRGFNQSHLLAHSIGSAADIAVFSRILHRTKKTKSQMKLARARRLTNLRGAFTCTNPLPPGKEIILIDDVATTGTTLEECARALKKAGAARVGALVISRGT